MVGSLKNHSGCCVENGSRGENRSKGKLRLLEIKDRRVGVARMGSRGEEERSGQEEDIVMVELIAEMTGGLEMALRTTVTVDSLCGN